MSYELTTKEQNDQKRHQYRAEICELNRKIEDCEFQIREMENENVQVSAAVSRRNTINSKIEKSKTVGKTLIIIGVIIGVLGCGLIFPIPIGLVLLVFGIIMRKSEKKYAPELTQINVTLSQVDSKTAEIQQTIRGYRSKVYGLERQIEELDMQDLEEKIATGYVGLYATQEYHFGETKPREPQAKKYASSFLIGAQLYINDMLYGTVHRETNRSFGIFEIDEPGTLRLEVLAKYEIGPEKFDWQSAPTPVRLEKGSKYIWVHISTSHVYSYVFDSLKAFMDATGISKTEIMEKVPK